MSLADDLKRGACGHESLCDEASDRIFALEAGLREIERVADVRTIPDRHGKMIESCNETCLHECVALARKILRGDPLPHRQQK